MPTGYTLNIEEGIDFRTFALQCARAFGACISQRDDNSNNVPELQKKSTYHSDRITEIKCELKEIMGITEEEISKQAKKEYEDNVKNNEKTIDKRIKLKIKYENMREEVYKWNPPTTGHTELKKFMLTQIEESIKFDCDISCYEHIKIEHLSSEQWKCQQIRALEENIIYHTKSDIEEIKTTESRNGWIKKLNESLR